MKNIKKRHIRIDPLDKKFSQYIRSRDSWTCQRCFKKYNPPTSALHCSHFHGRRKKSVRYDVSNCVAMCYGCHMYFTANPLEHMEWFKKRLGEKEFQLLNIRANQIRIFDKELTKIKIDLLMDELNKEVGNV